MDIDEALKVLKEHPDPAALNKALAIVGRAQYHAGYAKGYGDAVTCKPVIKFKEK